MVDVAGIGKNKWLEYYFDGKDFRENSASNFSVKFKNVPTQYISFNQACRNVTREIFELYKHQRIYISMSGGCDSETVANSFYNEGITFVPIINEFYYGGMESSYADTWWAKRWCKERNIEPYINRININDYKDIALPIANKLKARKLFSMQNVLLSRHAKDNDGILINGQAFIEYYPEPTLDYLKDILQDPAFENHQSGWLLHEDDFYIDIDDPGYHPYNFLSWNREIVLSYVKTRDMNLNSEENKFKIMGCSPRPKLAAPDIVWTRINDAQQSLKKQYGTSEVCFLGTHEELIDKLECASTPIYRKKL